MEKPAAPRRVHRAFRKETAPAPKKRAPRNAPTGNPMKRRSKKSEGMMKKLRSLKSASVKSTVEKEREKSAAASRRGWISGSAGVAGVLLACGLFPDLVGFMGRLS